MSWRRWWRRRRLVDRLCGRGCALTSATSRHTCTCRDRQTNRQALTGGAGAGGGGGAAGLEPDEGRRGGGRLTDCVEGVAR